MGMQGIKYQKNIVIGGLLLIVMGLTSCSNYNYMSENDVYMQAPTAMDLGESEKDLTSFNSYKARQNGAFIDVYDDPRMQNPRWRNTMMIQSAYMPYGLGYGSFTNAPLAFHGMGMPIFGTPSYGYAYGYGHGSYYGSGIGMFSDGYYAYGGGRYDGFGYYAPYGYGYYPHQNPYGYGYSPYGYGYSPYGYVYNPYAYTGGYYGSNQNSGNNQPTYYGPRSAPSGSANRTVANGGTPNSNPGMTTSGSGNKGVVSSVNSQPGTHMAGNSRREVRQTYASYSSFNPNTDNVGNTGAATATNANVNRASSTNRRAVNQHYTPSASARRTNVVHTSVNRGTQVGTSRGETRATTPQRQTASPSHSTQHRGSFSTRETRSTISSPASTNTSSPSSTRSSSRRR